MVALVVVHGVQSLVNFSQPTNGRCELPGARRLVSSVCSLRRLDPERVQVWFQGRNSDFSLLPRVGPFRLVTSRTVCSHSLKWMTEGDNVCGEKHGSHKQNCLETLEEGFGVTVRYADSDRPVSPVGESCREVYDGWNVIENGVAEFLRVVKCASFRFFWNSGGQLVGSGDTGNQSRRKFSRNLLVGLMTSSVLLYQARALAVSKSTRVEPKEAPSPFNEERLLQQNRRMQKLNGVPEGFPGFIREGFDVKVITDNRYVTTKTGLIYCDLVEGQGEAPTDGQQVVFNYIGYNESGRRVDSSYQQGQPARTRVGINGMIPGFEEGIKSMRVGGKRRIVIPPDLGPPVGPSTFFSAKQFEVFDVELLDVKSCERRTIFLYSDVVCQ